MFGRVKCTIGQHSWGAWGPDIDSPCLTVRYCEDCHAKELGISHHRFNTWERIVADGVEIETRKCIDCGKVEKRPIKVVEATDAPMPVASASVAARNGHAAPSASKGAISAQPAPGEMAAVSEERALAVVVEHEHDYTWVEVENSPCTRLYKCSICGHIEDTQSAHRWFLTMRTERGTEHYTCEDCHKTMVR
jgi:hypothetical protein